MLIIKLIRFLLGYVEFTCEGGFSERFVNLCFASHIRLWNVRTSDGVMNATSSLSAFSKLDDIAAKSGMTVTETNRSGLPVIIYNNRFRAALLVSSVLSCCIVYILSSMIWSVSVSGNERYTDRQILDIFSSYNVRPGVFCSRVDVSDVQNAIVKSNPDIIWCSVNIVGSRAFIEIRERVESPDMYTDSDASNIVAPSDGVLTRLEVYSGEGAAEVGSAVLKGQLLISGVIDRAGSGGVKKVNSDGKIEVRHDSDISVAVGENDPRYRVNKFRERSGVYFLGMKIPLGFSRESDRLSHTESFAVSSSGATLPLGIISDRYVFLSPDNSPLDSRRLLLLACSQYFNTENKTLDECERESLTVSYDIENGICSLSGKYVLRESKIVRQYIKFDD